MILVVSPYNNLATQIDTLRVLSDSLLNRQQVQSAQMDSICESISQLINGQAALYDGRDSMQAQIQTIAENGVGYSDALGHIALPLIIALFAFAFTYLFSVITRINEKYNSECISDMFKTCLAYRCYMWGSGIIVFFIILMGILSLALTGIAHQVFMSIMSWSCIVVAGIYAGIILWFVRVCIQYDDNLKMLELISERYQKEAIKSSALNVRMQRQIDICKYAIREQNDSLYLMVLRKVNEQDKAEKDEKKKNFSFYTMSFYESIVDSFIQTPHDSETEGDLVWNWQQTFFHNQLPQLGVIYRMLGKMVEAVKQGRFSLFEAYMDKSRLGYDFINHVPKELFVSGQTVAEQIKIDEERLETWRELREIHYLATAYLFSLGHYEVASVLNRGVGYNNHSLIPTSPAGILVLFSYCKTKQDKTTGSYNNKYWSLDKVIGYKYEPDILEKFTALMLLMAVRPDEDEEHIISEEKQQIILGAKAELIRIGHLWQKHAELLSRYPMIADVKIEAQIEEGIKHLTNGDFLNEKPSKKTLCEKIVDGLGWCKGKKKNVEPQSNIFDLKITSKEVEAVNAMFCNLLYGNRESITDCLNGELTEDKHDEIVMGDYTFLARKQMVLTPEIWQDYRVFNDMKNVFRTRHLFIIYEALSQMRIKNVTWKWDDFEKRFKKHVKNEGDKYAIIDTDSMMAAIAIFDKLPEGQIWSLYRHYKGAYYYNAGLETSLYMRDLPLVGLFKKTAVIVRLADLPCLTATTDDGLPKVNLVDESSKENGWAAVRITVESSLVAKYNKNAEVIRVSFKR